MADNICIIIKEPERLPETKMIDGSLRTLQTLVGGYIEDVHTEGLPEHVSIICDEEGNYKGRDVNLYIHNGNNYIVGTALFIKWDDGEPTSLIDTDIKSIIRYCDNWSIEEV